MECLPLDPVFQRPTLFRRKLTPIVRGHHIGPDVLEHRQPEPAIGDQRLFRVVIVKGEFAAIRPVAVTVVAVLDQDRFDRALKGGRGTRLGQRFGREARDREQRRDDESSAPPGLKKSRLMTVTRARDSQTAVLHRGLLILMIKNLASPDLTHLPSHLSPRPRKTPVTDISFPIRQLDLRDLDFLDGMVSPISQGILADHFDLNGPVDVIFLLVISLAKGIAPHAFQKSQNQITVSPRWLPQLENLDANQDTVRLHGVLVFPSLLQLIQRKPIRRIPILNPALNLRANLRIPLVPQMHQICCQLILMLRRHIRHLVFDVFQTHVAIIPDPAGTARGVLRQSAAAPSPACPHSQEALLGVRWRDFSRTPRPSCRSETKTEFPLGGR
jgi:hypothetical protein